MAFQDKFDSDLFRPEPFPKWDEVQGGAGLDGTDIRKVEMHIGADGQPHGRPIGERINQEDLQVFSGRAFPVTAYQHPYYQVDFVTGGSSDDADQPVARPEANIREAQVISSELTVDGSKTGYHTVMLDIDHPVRVVASSTPGHYHLYIDVPVLEEDYFVLLKALAEAGVIEEGYYEASSTRNGSHLRLPWIRKDQVSAPAETWEDLVAEKFDAGRAGVNWAIPKRLADAIQQSKDGDVAPVEGFSLDDFVEVSRPTEESPTGLPGVTAAEVEQWERDDETVEEKLVVGIVHEGHAHLNQYDRDTCEALGAQEPRVNEAEETVRLDRARAQFHDLRGGVEGEITFDPAEYAVTYVDGVGVLRRRRS